MPLTAYFSQDDFFHLRLIMNKEVTDIPWFFTNFLEGQTFYRPLSREVFNLLMYKSFGLNPLPFHFINLFLIFFIGLLLFVLIKKMCKNSKVAIFSLIVYLFSSVHSIELYYLASVQTLWASVFSLLSLIFYLKFLEKRFLSYYLSSVLFYLIALFCHESVIILPGIIILISLLNCKSRVFFKLCQVVPIIISGFIYILSIGSLSSLPTQQVYQPVFNPKSVLNTLSWFILWSFGLPETLVDFVKSGFILKEEFIIWYRDYSRIVFPLLFMTVLLLILKTWLLKKILLVQPPFYFFIGSFLTSVLPFLFFPQHKFVYYLSLPIVWFSASLGFILATSWCVGNMYRSISLVVIFFLFTIFYQTINFNSITYWAAKRAEAAEVLTKQLITKFPAVPSGSIFYIMDDPSYPEIAKEWGTSSKQAFYILSGSDAIWLLYKDTSLKVFYQGIQSFPKNVNLDEVNKFVAKFPY